VLPKPGQALPVGAELKLDVNAPALTDYEGDDGWSVYIVRTGAGEAVPTLRDWVFFEDLTPVTGDVGGIAAAVLGSLIHVFWTTEGTPYGLLNHLTIDSAGVISPTTIVDQYAVGFSAVSAAVHKGGVNAFYCANRKASFPEGGTLGVLRRAVITPPAGVFELFDIDGDGVSSGGAVKGVVGIESSAVSTGDELHVLYLATRDRNVPGDPGDGLGASIEDLRHASVNMPGPEVAGAPYIWLSETIDGAGGVEGKVPGDTGTSIAAMIDQAAQVHVFYSLGRITGTTGGFDLRHAELDYVGGATEKWRRETLVGAGSTFANAKGQKKGRVGLGTAGVRRNGELNVFYNDDDFANLRWGGQASRLSMGLRDHRRQGAAGGDPVEVLRGALHATKANGQPDWQIRVSAARMLAALPPEESEPEPEPDSATLVYDLPPGSSPIVHCAPPPLFGLASTSKPPAEPLPEPGLYVFQGEKGPMIPLVKHEADDGAPVHFLHSHEAAADVLRAFGADPRFLDTFSADPQPNTP
jgi:hypothetical protein